MNYLLLCICVVSTYGAGDVSQCQHMTFANKHASLQVLDKKLYSEFAKQVVLSDRLSTLDEPTQTSIMLAINTWLERVKDKDDVYKPAVVICLWNCLADKSLGISQDVCTYIIRSFNKYTSKQCRKNEDSLKEINCM